MPNSKGQVTSNKGQAVTAELGVVGVYAAAGRGSAWTRDGRCAE